MLQIFYLANDYVLPKVENSKQSLEWKLYLKSEFRNSK
ncbi:hypothetical protein F3D3_3240 [Fusibacter sp. 3D3]|nr:hypothetical protein F3D3_3240 [Fusibacter sp. 3D3]